MTGVASPWSAGGFRGLIGPQLLFGAMYEDVTIERRVLAGCTRVFAIGASGDTALSLGSPERNVVAVDINPAQVAYLRDRLHGAARRSGAADRLLAAARRFAPLAGWTRRRVERFLALSDVVEQRRFFDALLNTRRFRGLLDAGLGPVALRRVYRPQLINFLPADFGAVLRARLRSGISTHPNSANPYARLLLAGQPPATHLPPARSVECRVAEAIAFLEAQPAGTFDGFTLSNVMDGPDGRFRSRLAAAVAQAGAPDAPVVLRTLREPGDEAAGSWAARDRSLIWGAIIVTTATRFPAAIGWLR